MHHLARSMAGEWVGHNIRVNSISPGIMNTRLSGGPGQAGLRRLWMEKSPMGMGDPEDLTGAVVLLCSDAGRFMTGIDIKIDGKSYKGRRTLLGADLDIQADILYFDFINNILLRSCCTITSHCMRRRFDEMRRWNECPMKTHAQRTNPFKYESRSVMRSNQRATLTRSILACVCTLRSWQLLQK